MRPTAAGAGASGICHSHGPCGRYHKPLFAGAAVPVSARSFATHIGRNYEPERAACYNIRSIPTLMLFRNGAVAAQRAAPPTP